MRNPPSPVDAGCSSAREAWRLRRELSEARALLWEYRTRPDVTLPVDLARRIDDLLVHEPPDPKIGREPGGNGTWPDEEEASAWAEDAWDAEHTLEIALRDARTLLSKAASFLDRVDETTSRLRDALVAHLAHRHEDRDRVLANLRERRKAAEGCGDAERVAKIDERIAQVLALTDQQLMDDRDVLLRLNM